MYRNVAFISNLKKYLSSKKKRTLKEYLFLKLKNLKKLKITKL